MTEHDATTTASATTTPPGQGSSSTPDDEQTTYVEFLRGEFPDWDIELSSTETWSGEERPLWVAAREGHHPQSELSAAKLHTRLSAYLEREQHRHAHEN